MTEDRRAARVESAMRYALWFALAACSKSADRAAPAPQPAPDPASVSSPAPAPPPNRGPFEVRVHAHEQLAVLAGKPGAWTCVQYEVTNRGQTAAQWVPAHLVLVPSGEQVAADGEATAAYDPPDWPAERPRNGTFNIGRSMKRVSCFDLAIADGQRARMRFSYGGFGADNPAWSLDAPL